MKPEDLITQAKRIRSTKNTSDGASMLAEAKEFLRIYAGEKSSFYKQTTVINQGWSDELIEKQVDAVLKAFIRYIENGLLDGVSIQRRAQLNVVSDFSVSSK